MGNANPKAAPRWLEVRLSPIEAEPPRGRNGLPCSVLATLGPLSDSEPSREAPWDEAVLVQLPFDGSALSVCIFARETGFSDPSQAEENFLSQVCLPYAGPGGLKELGVQPGGLPVVLQVLLTPGEQHSCKESAQELAGAFQEARRGVRPDRPCLTLSVRELPDAAPAQASQALDSSSWTLPPARRQLITLELQNAALELQKRKLMPDGTEPSTEEVNAHMGCTRQLQLIQQENDQIQFETARMRQKLDRTKAVLADSEQAQQDASSQNLDWKKTLAVMQQELDHCQERQHKIRANYEERVASLQSQLHQAWQNSPQAHAAARSVEITFNPRHQANLEMVEQEVANMQARIKEATIRRDDLQWQLEESKRKAEMASQQGPGAPGTGPLASAEEGPELQGLRAQARRNEAELEGLRQELALQHERQLGSERQQGLRQDVSQLHEELEELQRAREDERVRSESEIRELKIERDALRDKLDDATSELQRSRSQAEALKTMREQAESTLRPCVAELDSLRESNAGRAKELEQLRQCEEERKLTILGLEREQEVLVERISLKAAPLVEGGSADHQRFLEAKATDLSLALDRTRMACQEHEAELVQLRQQAEEAHGAVEVLRRSYAALQQSSGNRARTPPRSGGFLGQPSSWAGGGQHTN